MDFTEQVLNPLIALLQQYCLMYQDITGQVMEGCQEILFG